MATQLSAAQCVLLTVHLASEANIKALHAFTQTRPDALDPELVLRILLSYLPESVDPALYTSYVGEVASRIYLEQLEPLDIDTSPVAHLTPEQAQKRVKKLHLLDLSAPSFPPHAPADLLTRFLCHRAYRIDSETGLLTLIPTLVAPFIEQSEYLRTWFISLVLPLLRLGYEYYPGNETPMSLETFEKVDGARGIEVLLGRATGATHEVISPTDSHGTVARDLRGLVGPWMYGHTERKRRKLNYSKEEAQSETQKDEAQSTQGRQAFIDLSGVSEEDKTGHDWEHAFEWIVHQATNNFALVTNAVEEWDGPGDVDLGTYATGQDYLDDETQSKLERQYAQAAFASCYAVQAATSETIDGAHGILVRLAELLDFEPPPDLATSVQQLPKIDRHAELLHATESTIFLEPDVLLRPDHPLTTPKLETFMLLQMLVYTAYQLAGLGQNMSIVDVTKLRFFSNEDEQLALLRKIVHALASKGKRDEQQWHHDYQKLIWLWNWNIDVSDGARKGAGVFGKIDKITVEKELLQVLVASGCYSLVEQLYLSDSGSSNRRMTSEEVQQVILDQAMQWYDSASNGNRTRGSMKKASDLINYAQRIFPGSEAFRRASALLAATHSLSFYSLKLQHNVPFQPVNIRVSSDPLSLLPKVLEQNPTSYTKLDDIISIGRNLVAAGLPLQGAEEADLHNDEANLDMATKLQRAERRVIAMCVEAALQEDDFETAYSYIVNRLAPPDGGASAVTAAANGTAPQSAVLEDDISWRAAFLGGRYRPRDGVPPTLRRLEQRTELLSLALLLAPPSNLSEILGLWRRCEEETSSLLAAETAAEESFDDRADRRNDVPGGFTDPATEGMVFGQQRREVGRMAGSRRGGGGGGDDDEAPMGLFELARGASRAFSRNAFPLRGQAAAAASTPTRSNTDHSSRPVSIASRDSQGFLGHQRSDSMESADGGRVRRRDMVANAVTGGLASGIGWVLGATPTDRTAGGGSGGGGN